ncbi:RagB/SusD family nutrient uptake outer membrane protein [Dysgonomonas termitidis]|uniref:RagB/SusD family nutrient uptake outer membrane protein n=1 Tax=Dysgonomonas termitidis TaxID=1516126 RepID=A0ABV9KQS9_9BACT
MKKIIIILSIVVGLSLTLGGCSDYLDSDYLFDERRSIEDVFQNRDYANQWLADAYYFMSIGQIQDVSSKKSVPYNFADDMYFGDESEGYARWKSGQYNENGSRGETEPIWKNAYRGIRQASIFMQNIDKSKVFNVSEIRDLKGQAYFLRAYFYWYMLRLFGPIPIIEDGTVDYMQSYDEIAQARNTYDECVDFIVGDLIKAAELLPADIRPVQDIARPNRGAALALRAKVLLFAASPLYNGKTPVEIASVLVNKDGTRLLPEAYDESKWAKAAAAALDVMNMGIYSLHYVKVKNEGDIAYPKTLPPFDDNDFVNGSWPNGYNDIDPFESYRSLFNGDTPANELMQTELIFTRGQNGSGEDVATMVLHQLPRQHGKGYNSHGMTLKQCDAYYMADGTDCPGMNSMYAAIPGYTGRYNTNPRETGFVTASELANYPELGEKGVGVSKQFARREPRFYASVAYNGSTWNFLNYNQATDEKPNLPIFYYRGGDNGYTNATYWLRTGIGIKKYVSPQDISNTLVTSYDKSRFTKKVDPAIRYAEILLIYAEAVNELNGQYTIPTWNGNGEHTIKRTPDELKRAIRPIRMRAGVPDYSQDVYGNSDLFRIKLKRERQIELFAEGHRYFDLRRWCDAPFEEAAQVYGYNAYATQDLAVEFHIPTLVPSLPSIFATRMWLLPINHKELRNNPKLVQNPGWTTPE